MKDALRRDIAYIAGILISGVQSGAVYDYQQGAYTNISGNVQMSHISVYDYSRGCYVTGSGNSLYDYGNGAHISLTISGNRFNGYDYGSGSHFSGNVNGRSIALYDYETSQHWNYSI